MRSNHSARLHYGAGARQQLTRREPQVWTAWKPAPLRYLFIARTCLLWQKHSAARMMRATDVNRTEARASLVPNYRAHCLIWQERSSSSHGASYRFTAEARASPLSKRLIITHACHIWQERVRSSHCAC